MTERLDRIEALLERTAEQQSRNTEDIDALVEAISTTDVEVRQLTEAIAHNQKRFDTLRRESIADRTEFRSQAESDRAEFRRQIEEERRRSDLRFEAMQENIQRLFLEMTRTNHRVDDLEQAS
jgi:predicted RNase H-like nuclease (RuvC/YqgF family)